ncbi:hypothetical protein [Blastococcus sp. PRF04-17]|uniref:hypothetical protein n=1 Tax=Blastococcus sp. PRF04-17 TaxID=2933797 RepID=UPI001FF63541|nr:hypothetical protein [Blastococcus sp. PRF04-17]UOY03133.1 hypothetical protein MVA48_07240 [Blastococcus sp. PRF04-17]
MSEDFDVRSLDLAESCNDELLLVWPRLIVAQPVRQCPGESADLLLIDCARRSESASASNCAD